MRSVTLPVHRGSPKTTRDNFLTPKLYVHYTIHMGLRRRLRVVLYWSIPMLKQFLAAKKLSPVKIFPKNGGSSKI